MASSVVSSYLRGYADPLIGALPALSRPLHHIICIPLCDEDARFLETLESLTQVEGSADALVVLIVNGAEDADDSLHRRNEAFLIWLRALLGSSDDALSICEWQGLKLLVVDCATEGRRLPAKQGVGLARKMAGDLALALYAAGTMTSPWMSCTDADVQLPRDYLTALPPAEAPHAAALYPFRHILEGSPTQRDAMLRYECYLHYFVLGMRWAGSPYAYHSIGSSFAVHLERYAAVRGFPRRRAAEDFYLLNKLKKQAPFVQLETDPILIRGRESDRVPFGTGKAVRDIQAEAGPYRIYDPRVFTALQIWLQAQDAFSRAPDGFDWSEALACSELPEGLLQRCLQSQGALDAAHKAVQQAPTPEALKRRLFEWNDAFRSLRLIHLLRDEGLPSVPLLDGLRAAPFGPGADTPCRLEEQRSRLIEALSWSAD